MKVPEIVGDMNARYNFWIVFSSEFCVEFKMLIINTNNNYL